MLLEPLERATKYLSASSYPTMCDTRLVFLGLKTHLKKYANDDSFSQRTMAALISHKIDDYWIVMDCASTVSAILDPEASFQYSHKSQNQVLAHIFNLSMNSIKVGSSHLRIQFHLLLVKRIADSISHYSVKIQTKMKFPLQSRN